MALTGSSALPPLYANQEGYNANSSTLLLIGIGQKTINIPTTKAFAIGNSVKIFNNDLRWMFGDVISHDPVAGILVVDVVAFLGTGSFNNWKISLSGPQGPRGDALLGGNLTGPLNEANGNDLVLTNTSDNILNIWNQAGNSMRLVGDFDSYIRGFTEAPQRGAKRTLEVTQLVSLISDANIEIQGVLSGGNIALFAGDMVDIKAITNTTFSVTIRRRNGIPATTPDGVFNLGGINQIQGLSRLVVYNSLISSTANGAMGSFLGSALQVGTNTVTGSSIRAGGTVNTSGNDYAEYFRKAETCSLVSAGQVVGITSNNTITDKWSNAVMFLVKSTNPSFVGGDDWASHLGTPPTPEDGQEAMDQFNTDLEAARERVDRLAIAGRVTVNIYDTNPGDYLVPTQDGESIGLAAVSSASITFDQYKLAIGRVISIETDGRAYVMVKPI